MKLLLVVLAATLCLGQASFLDLEELENLQYDIQILSKPVQDREDNLLPASVSVVNKFGQKYRCQLPEEEEKEKDSNKDKDKDGQVSSEAKPAAEPVVSTRDSILSLLSPLASQPCLLRTKDWWTYEFCYGKHIIQYHMEGSSKIGHHVKSSS